MSQSNSTSQNGRPSSEFHVLILGAGLGGLALAQCLRQLQQEETHDRKITFEIFERDESLSARKQGWAIALHGMIDDLLRGMPSDMPDVKMVSHLGPLSDDLTPQLCFYPPAFSSRSQLAVSQSEQNTEQPRKDKRLSVQSTPEYPIIRANRTRLREWLSYGITDRIHWGKKLTTIVQEHNEVTLSFTDGTQYTGDMLIGADGVRSVVRDRILKELRPEERPKLETLPIATIIGEVALNMAQLKRQQALGNSAYATVDKDLVVFVGLESISPDIKSIKDDDEQTKAADYYWFVTWNDPTIAEKGDEFWTQTATKEEMKDFALKRAEATLDDRFTEIIRATPVQGLVKPIIFRDMLLENMPPVGNRRVTVLGDAAHPMTPFRGEGGCYALRDTFNLAQALKKIVSQPSEISKYITEYEHELVTRSSEAVRKSRAAWNTAEHIWGQDLKVQEYEMVSK